jgi:uncharacterized protein YgbK (DUF1537 family)
LPVGAGVLVVAASRHPRTLEQIEAVRAAGITVICPEPAAVFNDVSERAVQTAVQRTAAALAAEGAAVLTTAGMPALPAPGEVLAARLAGLARRVLATAGPAGLVLTGGDAAIAVNRALRTEALWLRGEVVPGIPWGYLVGGSRDGLPLVTKAGGFGEEAALLTTIRFLQGVKR